ncbi:MAG TPA: class I SAM-dependent methyltransferase [Tangfeifania sp.]|nr:class I SAM-dependent methyltransferase [Tangfeifania sp.]
MNQFWNERFAVEEYVYGTEPNQFFKNQLEKLQPGKILFPAEGEGRNAVYAATQKWDVTAFDSSTVAKKKAETLARQKGVVIDYRIADYENVSFPEENFDCLVLIYAHMHPLKRKEYHQKLASFIKPGGTLILEGFSKQQIENKTGGPRNVEMLFSEEELRDDFGFFSEITISQTDVTLDEGPFHQGKASVIRVTGEK